MIIKRFTLIIVSALLIAGCSTNTQLKAPYGQYNTAKDGNRIKINGW